jgi:phosphoenolpyruvate synthase/pyruvate phosphate dikinase
MHASQPIISLRDDIARDRTITGNKAATLACLLARGYPVPDGVVLSAHTPINDRRTTGTLIARALKDGGLSAPWVVRSSSTVEDGSDSAFPGVFKTVLGVEDEPALGAAALEVRASSDSELAKRYVNARRLNLGNIDMAVLVQSQLQPDAAGVAFSRDPVTGKDHVGVEANYGLGETVVDGSVSPDYFVVNRSSKVVTRKVGTKKEQVVYGAEGLERRPVPDAARATTSITNDQAIRIAALAWKIERELGAPQDIEWAFVGSTLYLLQARPITTGGASS